MAGLPETHVKDEVTLQVTISPLFKVEVVKLGVETPTGVPLTLQLYTGLAPPLVTDDV
jgi:hypothetical protein